MAKSVILNNQEINHKIRRIAFQILENNSNEKELILAGIAKNGFLFAKRLERILNEISTISIKLCEVKVDKKNLLSPIRTSILEKEYQNKSLILVDDVLNSGSTLIYAIRHFLNVPLKQFKTAVLVNRNHKKYPVKADFKGISLSTSIQEHITVEFSKNNSIAYLD
jgi:pyrimidine operon attenuation protein/uracil phosphoribosyltransferase